MKLKQFTICGMLFLLSSSVYANDACTTLYDKMDEFYETLHKEGISPERTLEYRQDVANSRMHHAGFNDSDKEINNKYCQEELTNIESTYSLIRTLFENQE